MLRRMATGKTCPRPYKNLLNLQTLRNYLFSFLKDTALKLRLAILLISRRSFQLCQQIVAPCSISNFKITRDGDNGESLTCSLDGHFLNYICFLFSSVC